MTPAVGPGKGCEPALLGDLDEATLDRCLHIVALMGPEPYHAALEAGAEIIIGGCTSDPAVIAAFALWKGAPQGPSWHAGKIAECGGQVTTANTGQRGLLIEIHKDGFDAEPAARQLKTSVESISAHLLYENKSPWRLTEPGGEIAKACNPYFFHMPVRLNDVLPSYGWAFTPGEIDRGPVYEFVLNHVVSVDDPMELVPHVSTTRFQQPPALTLLHVNPLGGGAR